MQKVSLKMINGGQELKDSVDQTKAQLADIAINIKRFGAKCDGVTDDTAAFQAAIDYAINQYTLTGLGGPLKHPAVVLVPAGTTFVGTLTIDLRLNNAFVSEAPYIKIVGTSSSRIKLKPEANLMFDIPKANIIMEDLNLLGHSTGVAIKLGEVFLTDNKLNVVSQSEFSNVRTFGFNKGYDIHHAFDTRFNNGGVFSCKGTSPVGVHLRTHDHDNCNNLVFDKFHIEEMPGGVMFLAEGSNASPSRVHNNIYWFAPHFETRYINTRIMRLSHCLNIYFAGGQYTQNNSHGEPLGILPATHAVPAFEFSNARIVNFSSVNLFRVGVATYLKKLVEDLGGSKHIRFESSYMFTASNTVNPSITDVLQHDNTNQQIRFKDCVINDTSTVAVDSNINTLVSSATVRNRKFYAEYVEQDTRMKLNYSSDVAGYGSPTTLFDVFNDGRFGISSLTTTRPYVVPNATIASIDASFTTNTNKSGMYFIFAQGPFAAFAIIYRHGTNIYPVIAGTDASVSSVLGDVAGKLNIGIESNLLKVKNNLGSERSVMVVPMVF